MLPPKFSVTGTEPNEHSGEIYHYFEMEDQGHSSMFNVSGIRGGCCNPSYWEDRIGGWPLCRRSAKGSKWLAEGPHYTSGLVLVGGADPDPPGADPIRIC